MTQVAEEDGVFQEQGTNSVKSWSHHDEWTKVVKFQILRGGKGGLGVGFPHLQKKHFRKLEEDQVNTSGGL